MEHLPTFSDQLDVDYISHHGIRGMHWGIRRYQNPDGTLTDAGRKHYAVRESKRGISNSDLRKANEKGGYLNRNAVRNQVTEILKNDPQIKAAENDCKSSAREGYAEYANLYNKHAEKMGVSNRLDPKTFNWYINMQDLDYDVDGAVWDDRSKSANKLYSAIDRHRKNVDKLETAHANAGNRFIKEYHNAVLRDIPNDGSKQATERILDRYGQLDTFDFTASLQTNGPEYGWSVRELFDA